jgi:hypothetical protein
MAKFSVYNIQLLPNEEGIDEVGKSGYRKLFSELRKLNDEHTKRKTLSQFHFPLTGDLSIGPEEFNFPAGYIYGYFIRYTKTDEVTDLHTGKTLFRSGARTAAISNKNDIPFVFDTDLHRFAIDSAYLPKPSVFLLALEQFFRTPAETAFPNHTLKINLVSKPGALEEVFKTAVSYKTIDVSLTFPNGSDTEEILRELKDNKTQQLTVHASGGQNGRMSGIPEFLKDLLRAATSFGKSKVTYFVGAEVGKEVQRRATYNSEDTPLSFNARRSAHDTTPTEFFERAVDKLRLLATSREAEVNETLED